MINLHPEYVVDEKGQKRAILLPVEQWEQVVDALEELEDIRLYDKAKSLESSPIPFDDALQEIDRDQD